MLNDGRLSPDYMALYIRRQNSCLSLFVEVDIQKCECNRTSKHILIGDQGHFSRALLERIFLANYFPNSMAKAILYINVVNISWHEAESEGSQRQHRVKYGYESRGTCS
jgi:hypothetical protein